MFIREFSYSVPIINREKGVTLYKHGESSDHTFHSSFGVGTYNGTGNFNNDNFEVDSVTTVQVLPGFKVKLYKGYNKTGEVLELTSTSQGMDSNESWFRK